MTSSAGSPERRPLLWFARFSASLLIMLLILELIVRTWIHAPAAGHTDEVFGNVLRPHSTIIESDEGFARHSVDGAGRVDQPLDGDVEQRVLLLGDSFSVAQQIAHGDRFSEIVEQRIAGLEVVNQALGGWYPPYYAAWLRHHDTEDFDAVVVQLSDGDLFELERNDRIRMRFAGEGDWDLSLEPFSQPEGAFRRISRKLSRTFALYDLVRWRTRLLMKEEQNRLLSNLGGRAAPAGGIEERVPAEAIEVLLAIDSLMRAEHPFLLYLYIPRLEYTLEDGAVRWPEAREAFHEFASRSDAILVDPTPQMLDAFSRDSQPLHGFHNSVMGEGHLNAQGHELVGDVLAEALEDLLQ